MDKCGSEKMGDCPLGPGSGGQFPGNWQITFSTRRHSGHGPNSCSIYTEDKMQRCDVNSDCTVGMLGGLGGHKFEAYLGVSGAI